MNAILVWLWELSAHALELPSLIFTVWGLGEALRADVSFPAGCMRVPELRSVMRITPKFVKDALRYAVREQLCVAGVWVLAQ